MKKIYLILFIVLVTLQIKAQFVYDKWGEIIPFSLTEKYKNLVKYDELHSLLLPSYNNDSLCRVNNNGKGLDEIESVFAYGFTMDTLIDFKQNAEFFELENGNLWVYTIESPTANVLGIHINDFDVLPGCYFSVIPGKYPYEMQEPETYIHEEIPERIKEHGLNENVDNIKMVLEYFEPKGIKEDRNYIINSIIYGYAGGFGQALIKSKKEKKKEKNDSIKLKSGYYENPNDLPLPCQNDVVSTNIGDWGSEAKSVGYIRIPFVYNNQNLVSTGTCSFLNKEGGYSGTDYPIILTCGHLFAPEVASNLYYDISNNYTSIDVIVDYENKVENETTIRYGKPLGGSFSSPILGISFNPGVGIYHENDDYAIIQPSRNVDRLARYNILYAGWTSSPNFLNNGYAAIGHPKNTVKKVNVENSRAWANSDNFGLYFDLGVTEHGFSGSPIFNSNKQIVGWLCTGTGDCSTIGQENNSNHTTCGRFDHLYFYLTSYIDPNYVGEAASSNPIQPTPLTHCGDCIQNYDETGIDCGGESCYPCGMQDVITLKTPMDIPGNTAKSRYELFAEPDPNTLLALKSGSYSFEAGLNVHLNGGFEVEKGAEFYAGIDAELMSEPDRGCGNYCINANNVFFPDADGYLDYWAFRQAFMSEYDIYVYTQYNALVYSATNQPVYENGVVNAWDGSGADPNTTYFRVIVISTDCFGNNHTYDSFTHCFRDNNKSAIISEDAMTVRNIEGENVKIKVYPNPFSNNVTINFSGDDFPLEYKVIDLNGKVLLKNTTSSNHETIDLNNLASGTYVINAKAGDYNLIQKLVKK